MSGRSSLKAPGADDSPTTCISVVVSIVRSPACTIGVDAITNTEIMRLAPRCALLHQPSQPRRPAGCSWKPPCVLRSLPAVTQCGSIVDSLPVKIEQYITDQQ